tara:strand:+ start:485 stop:841 length:357 start_codon:yes stop_codon:yes gene_type:complete
MSLIQTFNKNIINFMKDLSNIVDNKEISNIFIDNIKNIQSVIYFNKYIFINKFYIDLYKYKNDIINENELVIEYLDKINFFDSVKLVIIWNRMNITNKQICWKYLKTFILLTEKIKNI